jgi:hypothetical protein
MIHWINTPCTDPIGRVFVADGRVYRAVFRGREDIARSVLGNREVVALMNEGLIARMWESDRKVDGFDLVVEAEKAPFDIPCERFTRATLRAAALRWLDTCKRLLPAGLVLSDAHYGNYMLFGANEPRWVDLGSICPPSAVAREQPFRSFRRFWSAVLAPLVLMETQPRQSRLARLAIADQPYQGPLTVTDEAPLSVDAPAADFLERLRGEVEGLGAGPALDKLREFLMALPHDVAPDVPGEKAADAAVLQEIEQQFSANRIASVICLGSDAFRQFSGTWGKADSLVVDHHEGDLDRLGRGLGNVDGGGQTALYLAHPVNRIFTKSPPNAEAVIAIDPLARFAHDSHVETENLAQILGLLASKLAVIVTRAGTKPRTVRMLEHEFPSVTAQVFSWLGFGPAVVVGRK